MIVNLKKKLKDDIWNLINGKTANPITKEEFVAYVICLMFGKDTFFLEDVMEIAKQIEETYSNIVSKVGDQILSNYGEILTTLKGIEEEYDEKITPLIKRAKHHN